METAGPSTEDLLKTIGIKQVTIEWLEDQLRLARNSIAQMETTTQKGKGKPAPELIVLPPGPMEGTDPPLLD